MITNDFVRALDNFQVALDAYKRQAEKQEDIKPLVDWSALETVQQNTAFIKVKTDKDYADSQQ